MDSSDAPRNGQHGQLTAEDGPAKKGKLDGLRERYPSLDHVMRAAKAYTDNNGNHYAAAITYFSVLALIPLLMVAFSIAAFILASDQSLLDDLKAKIVEQAPEGVGTTVNDAIDEALESKGSVGILGLLGATYSGLGWMGNLREALTAQWEQPHKADNFVKTKLYDLLALAGLGLALIMSFGITGAGNAFNDDVVAAVGLDGTPGVGFVMFLISVALSIGGMWLVFVWVIARLPREPVTARSAMRAALLAAVGFEILKQVFAVYLTTVTNGPAGQAFGPIIGLLVFAYTVSRFILFVTAWAATSRENLQEEAVPPPPPAVIAPRVEITKRPDVRTSASLVGVGAVAGFLARRRHSR